MATRHLRRLRGNDLDLQPCAESSSESEGGDDLNEISKPFNPYEFLASLDEQYAADEEIEEAGKSDEDPDDSESAKEKVALTEPPSAPVSKRKNKKNKKKNSKSKGKSALGSGGEAGPSKSKEEDIDKLIQELNLQTVGQDTESVGPSRQSEELKRNVLGVESGSLRADEELYRIFGAQVVASEEAQLRREKDNRHRHGRIVKGVRGMKKQVKSYWLVEVQDHWPAKDPGLSMEYQGEENGCYLFGYTESLNFQTVQGMFEQCQATGDPNMVMGLLAKNPLHVNALLAMHDLYRATGEHLYAEEMLNRCLYALERAWHPFFSPTLGTCKLDYQVSENRSFFMALFRHIQNLNRRGCMTTALECCKLLLSLDEDDPMGALCYIEYLAIRAGQFDFLQRLVDEMDDGSSLALMPGIAYSLALSKFKKKHDKKRTQVAASTTNPCPSTSLDIDLVDGDADVEDEGGVDDPDESLVQAVLLYPLVIVRLMGKLKEKGISMDGEWTSILGRKLFVKAGDGGSASLSHLVNLFVERHHLLWKASETLVWLKACCRTASDAADNGDPVGGVTADDWECVRSNAFPASETNEYRHLHLYDFSENAAELPQEAVQNAMNGGGLDDAMMEVEERMANALQNHGGRQGTVHLTQEELQNGNVLGVFLQSLLPWVQAGNQQPENPDNAQQDPN